MDYADHLPGMIKLLKELVSTESPSHDKTAVDRVGALIVRECQQLGGQVSIHPSLKTGDHIQVEFTPSHPTTCTSQQGILLLCHMDTVFPLGTLEKIPFLQFGDKTFGPGVSDMKGGIVVALSAISVALKENNLSYPVTALFTSDEEIGSHTSRPVIEHLAKKSSLVLVLEPGLPDGSLKTWRKGVGDFSLTARGKAAHAGGDHDKGRNAILEMAHQVIAIQAMTDYAKGTTLNVGKITGGIASNVVPDEASIEIDLRVLAPGEAERITTALHALKPALEGTSLELGGTLNRPPMPYNELNRSTFDKVQKLATTHGITLTAGGTGGASDANFVAPLGIPVLDGLGPAGGDYHSEREYIYTNSLVERLALLSVILSGWGNDV